MLRNRGADHRDASKTSSPRPGEGAGVASVGGGDDDGDRPKQARWRRRFLRGSAPRTLLLLAAAVMALVLLRAPISSGGVGDIRALESRNDLSLGILTHLDTAFPVEEMVTNQIHSLTTGPDSSIFRDIFVFYDAGSNNSSKHDRFEKEMGRLVSRGVLTAIVPLERDPNVPAAVGSRDSRRKDASAIYAIHRYITEKCETAYCAFVTYDIVAHGGGGLNHAKRALEEGEELIFAMPPTARMRFTARAVGDTMKELRFVIPPEDTTTDTAMKTDGGSGEGARRCDDLSVLKPSSLSTRSVVISKANYLKSIPFLPLPERETWFGNPLVKGYTIQYTNAVKAYTALTMCSSLLGTGSAGYLIHPPPFLGQTRLYEACGDVATLQGAVDHPQYYTVDIHNNMDEGNWTAACNTIARREKST